MISAFDKRLNNKASFTSVVPVRVFVDGMETFNQKNIIVGGIPAKIIKENVTWTSQPYDKYLESFS